MNKWELIEKFKDEVKGKKIDGLEMVKKFGEAGLAGIRDEDLFDYCKTHWIGKNLFCSKCHLFGSGICENYAKQHGADTINDYLMNKFIKE